MKELPGAARVNMGRVANFAVRIEPILPLPPRWTGRYRRGHKAQRIQTGRQRWPSTPNLW